MNTLIDSSAYFKEVVSPYELQLALTPYACVLIMFPCYVCSFACFCCRGAYWTGQYTTDFTDILPSHKFATNTIARPASTDDKSEAEADSDGIRYSTVSRSIQ